MDMPAEEEGSPGGGHDASQKGKTCIQGYRLTGFSLAKDQARLRVRVKDALLIKYSVDVI